jgi:hypothetical protein
MLPPAKSRGHCYSMASRAISPKQNDQSHAGALIVLADPIQFVINLNTAKAGLQTPPDLIISAHNVIELSRLFASA